MMPRPQAPAALWLFLYAIAFESDMEKNFGFKLEMSFSFLQNLLIARSLNTLKRNKLKTLHFSMANTWAMV